MAPPGAPLLSRPQGSNEATADPGREGPSSRGSPAHPPGGGSGPPPAPGWKQRAGSARSQARGPADPAAPDPGLAPRGEPGLPRAGPRPAALPGPAGSVGRRHPQPAVRPQPRGLTASTACCKIEVNLENILSRDCSSLSRDDLESSSMRRRRPCCGCRGRSRVKAGAGRGGRAEGRRRPGRPLQVCAGGAAARAGGRARGRGGRGGRRRARTWAPRRSGGGSGGSGWDTVAAGVGLLPPAFPAAACRGRRRDPGRPGPGCPAGRRPDAAGAGEARRGRGAARGLTRAQPPPSPGVGAPQTQSFLRCYRSAGLTQLCFQWKEHAHFCRET